MYGSTNGFLNNVTPFNYITFSVCIEMTKLDGENKQKLHAPCNVNHKVSSLEYRDVPGPIN